MRSFLFIFVLFVAAGLLPSTAAAQTGSIEGRITYSGDVPIDGASVQIVSLKKTVLTDLQGRYEITDLLPGTYLIVVHQEGFSDATRSVTVKAGEAVTQDFTLRISALRAEVTVTGSGVEQTMVESIESTTSVGTTAITEKASTSLGEVLQNETGVAKRSFGPGSSRPVIWGFDGDRVLVLDNGVRTGSVGSQSGDHGETIDPLSAERIEIVKGPATLLYGSNALGGVVNVISNDEDTSHEGLRGNLTSVGGTADKQGALSGGLEWGRKNWLVRGNISAQRASDYSSPIGTVPNTASRSNTYSIGPGYYSDRFWLEGTYNYDVRRYGVPFASLFEAAAISMLFFGIPVPEEEVDIRIREHQLKFKGGFRNLRSDFITDIKYNFDYSDYKHNEIETADGVEATGTVFANKIFSYRSMFEQATRGKFGGRFGFEGFSRDYQVEGEEQLITGKVSHNSFSVFGLEEVNFERVKLQFGARVENNRYAPENPDLVNRSFTGFSGSAGANIRLWNGGAFVANYTSAYRSPALEELYNYGPHIGNLTFEIGNQELKNERANGVNLSVRHLTEKLRVNAGLFYYRINDFTFLAPQDEDMDGNVDIEDGLPVAKYSQENAEYFGGEFEFNYHFVRSFGFFVNGDFVRANLVDSNINLIRIPPPRIRAGLDINYKNLNVKPEVIGADKQDRVFPLETPTAGYGIVNLTGSYVIGRQHFAHIFTFNAYNLTNKLYRNHVSFIKDYAPEIGRGLKVSYTVRFF